MKTLMKNSRQVSSSDVESAVDVLVQLRPFESTSVPQEESVKIENLRKVFDSKDGPLWRDLLAH